MNRVSKPATRPFACPTRRASKSYRVDRGKTSQVYGSGFLTVMAGARVGENVWSWKGDQTARLLIASSQPLDALVLDYGPEASTRLQVAGGTLGELLLRPSGGVGFEIDLEEGRKHVMWWSPDPRWLYFLELAFAPPDNGEPDARPQPFRLGAVPEG